MNQRSNCWAIVYRKSGRLVWSFDQAEIFRTREMARGAAGTFVKGAVQIVRINLRVTS